MAYQPRFSDPRVRRRIERALGWARGVLSATEPREWSTRYIDQWLGQQQNQLSRYLRDQLLVVTDPHWNKDTGECKQYQLNTAGAAELEQALGYNNNYPIVLQVAEQEYRDELASGAFVYNDKSSRLWHPLQNWRREVKHDILTQAGYCYHYDIESCAMTLIHQASQQVPLVITDGRWQQGPMDLYLWHLRDYLARRHEIRAEIAAAAEITTDQVKRIINALLAGAKLSVNTDSQIYHMLDGDRARIRFLQQHEYLTLLRRDIKTCWDYLRPVMPLRTRTQADGTERRVAVSSRHKWNLYFELERRVLNEVRGYLEEHNQRHFLEHDGWSTDCEIDQEELQQRIHERTGFRVRFEMK